ncbi:DUF2813 domain-containing protein [[Pasteurella] aerogenes]
MYLRQLDIVGFRGINRLSLNLQPNMMLIGENAWGKSSLLAALGLIFNAERQLYQFIAADFYQSCYEHEKSSGITILFTFCESDGKEKLAPYNHCYQDLFVAHRDGQDRIYLRVTGEKQGDQIVTEYSFLDAKGDKIPLSNVEEIVKILIYRHPLYRFRDARLSRQRCVIPHSAILQAEGNAGEAEKEIQAVAILLQYYFLNHQNDLEMAQDTSVLWERAKSLCLKLKQDKDRLLQRELFRQLSSLFLTHEEFRQNKFIRPIVLFEDPEARLHPRMVAIAWELASYLPIQRISTTNSVELISQVPLRSIYRLVRSVDRTKSFHLGHRDLGKEDLRRLTFHIHHNRSLALFSRMWLLVEGETEVWILNELAELLGIDLAMEGIRIVEFAQCGLRPLLKYVKAMGIEWYVLTDGDEAGRKYAEVVKNLLGEDDNITNRLTVLPKRDIEHFFYFSGFEPVFLRLSRWQVVGNHYPASKIIQRAIQRTSKPDLAIALSSEIAKQGVQSIPILFKRLFSKVLNLARS